MEALKKLTSNRIIRFIVSGGTAAAAEYTSFIVLSSLFSILLVANTLSFCIGLIVSFTINRIWVFQSQAKARKQFSLYFGLAIVNLCISNVLIYILTYSVGIMPLAAKLVVMILVANWNYILFSKIIFRHKTPADSN